MLGAGPGESEPLGDACSGVTAPLPLASLGRGAAVRLAAPLGCHSS